MSCAVGAVVEEDEEGKRDMGARLGDRGGDANTRRSGGILVFV